MSNVARLPARTEQPDEPGRAVFHPSELAVGSVLRFVGFTAQLPAPERWTVSGVMRADRVRWSRRQGAAARDGLDRVELRHQDGRHINRGAAYLAIAAIWVLEP